MAVDYFFLGVPLLLLLRSRTVLQYQDGSQTLFGAPPLRISPINFTRHETREYDFQGNENVIEHIKCLGKCSCEERKHRITAEGDISNERDQKAN